MASSRWKRFAFFDRHTYTLPPTVMDDLIPRKGGSVVSSILDPNSNKTEDSLRRRIATAPLAEEVNSTGDYFSASVITASLPLENIKDAKDVKGGGGVGIKGMIGTMAACTDPSLFSSSADKAEPIISKSGKIAEEGKGLQVIMNGVKLVLVLLSSRHTPRVHIVDVTVRTNPLNHAEEEREQELEDLDGWRGYYLPFPSLGTRSTAAAASTAEQRVIADHLAREETAAAISALSSCTEDDNLHIAAITASPSTTGVVIHINPHLILSTSLTSPTKQKLCTHYAPSSAFNTDSYGVPTTVHVIPHLAAVGTSKGHVLLYSYSSISPSAHKASPGLMRVVLDIPPPKTMTASTENSCQVTAVQVVEGEKKMLFVTYRRGFTQSATDTSSSSKQSGGSGGGVCCYDLGEDCKKASARYDLDGRDVGGGCLTDVVRGRGCIVTQRSIRQMCKGVHSVICDGVWALCIAYKVE
mmetsp:Transcript_69273/g.103040  ORF Transcript_69273/g.103040 Transcript_69273/m.103040 type:complete len:469 (+) Transcript_69273:524-1930(+)